MIRRILGLAFVYILLLSSATVGVYANPAQFDADFATGSEVLSPTQQLSNALNLAKAGNIPEAVRQANATLKQFPYDTRTKLSYIETLVQMHGLPGDQYDIKLLNRAIRAANTAQDIEECDGSNDPELGFLYLRALGQLAYAVEPQHKGISCQIKSAIGSVAENLRGNPMVPQSSHQHLALPYFDKARAHAHQKQTRQCAESLQIAFELGFSDFDRALSDELLKKADNADEIKAILEKNRSMVSARKLGWAKTELENFSSFPFVFEVAGLNDGRISHQEYKGKILVVDIWATWCAPCRKAIPDFKRLQHEFKNKNVSVLGISVDSPENPIGSRADVQAVAKQMSFNYPCGLGDNSVLNQVPGQTSLPMTLFIDENGTVQYVMKGVHPYEELEAITKQMLGETH